ncbi:MAG: outer membrane protein assembly factor BamE [Gammaproteobacteria bacterium]
MRRYAFLLIACSLLTGGCALTYLAPVHQGNYLSKPMLRSVQIGMTEEQVAYLLGTPALKNPFSRTDWSYVFYQKASHFSRARVIRLEIIFHHGRVVRIIRHPERILS